MSKRKDKKERVKQIDLKSVRTNFGNAQNTLADECSTVGINCAQRFVYGK
jgi:hypothetical protein